MPDVSKHEAVLQGLVNDTYHTLGVSIGSHQVTPGEKIPKGGKAIDPYIVQYRASEYID